MGLFAEHIDLLIYLGLTGLALLVFYALVESRGADWGRIWLNAMDGLIRWFVRRVHRASLQSLPLPEQGAALVVCNHVSGLDPLLLVAASPRPLRFIIAHEQYDRFYLKWLFNAAGCIPVDRTIRPERALRHARSALRRGEVVALFPHGKIHLDSDPPRKLKRGASKLSLWSGAPIFPCRIDGVKGERQTLLALFILGRPELHVAPQVVCKRDDGAGCMDYLATVLEGRLQEKYKTDK